MCILGAIAVTSTIFSTETLAVLPVYYTCTGSEGQLHDCIEVQYPDECKENADAGVVCQGSLI